MPSAFFQSWYKDPEFVGLEPDHKVDIFLNFFDKQMADDEFYALPQDHQSEIRSNFLQQQGLSQTTDTTTTPISPRIEEEPAIVRQPPDDKIGDAFMPLTQDIPEEQSYPLRRINELPTIKEEPLSWGQVIKEGLESGIEQVGRSYPNVALGAAKMEKARILHDLNKQYSPEQIQNIFAIDLKNLFVPYAPGGPNKEQRQLYEQVRKYNMADEIIKHIEEKSILAKSERYGGFEAQLQKEGGAKQVVGDVAKIVPQVGSMLVVGMVGGPVASALNIITQITGMSYPQYLEAAKGDPDKAFSAAFLNGVMQAPFELIGLKGISKAINFRGPILQKIKTIILEGGGTEAVTEYIQSYPEKASELFAKQPNAKTLMEINGFLDSVMTTKFQKEALYQGAVGGLGGIVFGGLSSLGRTSSTESEPTQPIIEPKDIITTPSGKPFKNIDHANLFLRTKGLSEKYIPIETEVGWVGVSKEVVDDSQKAAGLARGERIGEEPGRPVPYEGGGAGEIEAGRVLQKARPEEGQIVFRVPPEAVKSPTIVAPEAPALPPTPEPVVEPGAVEPTVEGEKKGREPWEMTLDEYQAEAEDLYGKGTKESHQAVKKFHRSHIGVALLEGKPVPPEVLADYPDLTPTAQPEKEAPGVGKELQNITPEAFAERYGLKAKVTPGEIGGEYSGGTISVGDDRTLAKAFAGNWIDKDAPDFQTKNEYPENIRSSAHEIAHGLFSKDPKKGHAALKELQELGVSEDVGFESLVDMGGVYLLEPDAITNSDIKQVLDKWIGKEAQPVEPTGEKPEVAPGVGGEGEAKPKRRVQPIEYLDYRGETKLTAKSYMEYKGYRVAKEHDRAFNIIDESGKTIGIVAGLKGAYPRIDQLAKPPTVEGVKPYSYEGLGYTVTQTTKAKKDAQTKWHMEISGDLRDALTGEMSLLQEGEPGRRIRTGEGLDEEWIGQASSYPEWFKDQGWTQKQAVQAIKKAAAGKELGVVESKIVETAIDFINNTYYNDFIEVLENAGYTEGQIREAAKTGLLQETERVEAEVARLEREGRDGKYDQAAIDELDPWFTKPAFELTPEEPTKHEKAARLEREGVIKRPEKQPTKGVFPAGEGIKTVPGKQKNLFGTQEGETYDLFESEPTPEEPRPPTGYADVGGYATNINSVIELPEIVYLARELMQGKYPKIKEHLRKRNAAGIFYGKGEGDIQLKADIFSNPEEAAAILSHEIGHLIDYLPDQDLKRGNILGRIASLKKYMKHTLPKAPGQPGELTEKDRQRLRRIAAKLTKEESKDKWIDEEIISTLPIDPQDVLNIWNAVEKAKLLNPDLYDYIVRLNTPEKKSIVLEALRGQVSDQLSQFAKRIQTKTGKKIPIEVTKDMIFQRYKDLINAELKKRELFTRDKVNNELKALTRAWKPFNPLANPKYTQYRYSSPELYADAISALINAPGLLKGTAPRFYEGFFNYLENKPEVKHLYNEIQDDIKSGKIEKDRVIRLREGFRKKEEEYAIQMGDGLLNRVKSKDAWGTTFIDRAFSIIRRVKNVSGNVPDSMNPQYRIDDMIYSGVESEGYLTEIDAKVMRLLEKEGIDRVDLGEYLFHQRVSTERAELANPQGWTKNLSEKRMAEMEETLGSKLKESADVFRSTRQEWVIDKLKQVKMHSPELLDYIDKNPNYATFDIVGHMEDNYGREATGHIYRQIGSLGDVGDPFTATILKDIQLIRAANQNEAAKSVINFMEAFYPDEIKDADTKWNGKFKEVQKPKDSKTGLIAYLEDGKIVGKYTSKYITSSFEKNPVEAQLISEILRLTALPFKTVFTGINPGFWAFNVYRDYFRVVKNIKDASLIKFLPSLLKGIKPAFRSTFGIPDDVIKEMQKGKMLISIADYRGDTPEDAMYDRLLKRYSITPSVWNSKILKPFGAMWYYLDATGRALERVPKVGGYLYIKKNFPDMSEDQIKQMIRHRVGSPSFLTKGTGAPIYNNLLLFSNAIKEGWRSDINVVKDQPMDYMWKTAKYNILPKVLMFAFSMGIMGYFKGDDDEDTMKSLMDKASEYDKTNYTIIPLGVTPQGKAVYFRIPQDETGRLIGGITWKLLNKDKPEMWTNLFDYMSGQAPTIHPGWVLLKSVVSYASGQNPYDAFRGRYAIPDQVFMAGGSRSREAMAKWLWDQMGGGIVYRFGSDKPEQIRTELEKVVGLPVINNIAGRFIKVSDYGEREGYKEDKKLVRSEKAKESLDKKDAIEKVLVEEKLTEKESIAFIEGMKTIGPAFEKAVANKYGNVAYQEFLSAQSEDEKIAVMKRFFKYNPKAEKSLKKP